MDQLPSLMLATGMTGTRRGGSFGSNFGKTPWMGASDATLLGTFSITDAPAVGTVVNFSSAALLSFIQADANHLATLIIAEETAENTFETGSNGHYYRVIPFATRETAAGAGAPSLTVAVPEPAGLALLALGGLGLLARRRAV